MGVLGLFLCGCGGIAAYIYYKANAGLQGLAGAMTDAAEKMKTAKQDPGPGQSPVDRALQFKGRSYVELEKTGGLLDLNASFTVEMWVRVSRSTSVNYLAGDEAWPGMSPEISTKSLCGWVLRTRGEQGGLSALDFTIATKNEWIYVIGKAQLEQDRWYHVAVSKSPDMIRLYVNGDECLSRSCKGLEFIPSPTDLYLGVRKNAHTDRSFEGAIRAFRVSSGARPQNELKPDQHFTRQPDTLILLDFSAGGGTQLPDLLRAHPGSVVGAEWIDSVPPGGQKPPGDKPGPTTNPPGTPTVVLKAIKTFLTDSSQSGPRLSLSRDGSQAVTVIEGGHLWDTASGKELPWNDPEIAKSMKENVHTAVYSADGNHLWTSIPQRIAEVNAKTHKIERSVPTEEYSVRWGLYLSPNEKYIATDEEVYDVQAKRKIIDFTKELGRLEDVTFGHDGKTVVGRGMAGLNGFQGISLWNLESAKLVQKIEFKGDALLDSQFVACSPTTDVFAMRTKTGDGEVVEIRDLTTGEVKATFGKGLKLVKGSLAWSPDGKYLSVTVDLGFVDHGFRRAVWLLDATTGKPVASLSPAPEGIDRVAFSGDGTRFAILSPNSDQGRKMDLILWDMTQLPK